MGNRWGRRGLLLAAGAIAAGMIGSCAPQSGPRSGDATPADVLVYGSGGNPVNLEPGNFIDGYSQIVQTQIYDRLLRFKEGGTELEPALATKWVASDGGKVWTFTLRSGVKFHDGTPCNAQAVQLNVRRWWDPKEASGFRASGKTYEIWQQLFGGFKGSPNGLLQDVQVVNATTVRFVLKQPFAAFPSAIASGFFGIASPTAIQKAGAAYGTPGSVAVGTGPFQLKEWKSGDRAVLEKNPNYWRSGYPKMSQLVIRFIQDPASRLAQLRAGQIDFTISLSPDQKPEIESDANLAVVTRPSFNVGYLALNPSYKPLSDGRVRRAIALGLRRSEIVKGLWGELGYHDGHFLPETLKWAHSPKVSDYPTDPTQAKALLKEAGYPNGFDLELWYMPVSRDYFPTPKALAEILAADLSELGIRVSLKTKDWAAYLSDRNKSPGFQSYLLGWVGDYGDPDSFYYPNFGPESTTDLGNWKNLKLWQLLDQGRAESNLQKRAKIYHEVDEILHQEIVRLPIAHSQTLLAKRKTVQGWIPSPLGAESFESISKGEISRQ